MLAFYLTLCFLYPVSFIVAIVFLIAWGTRKDKHNPKVKRMLIVCIASAGTFLCSFSLAMGFSNAPAVKAYLAKAEASPAVSSAASQESTSSAPASSEAPEPSQPASSREEASRPASSGTPSSSAPVSSKAESFQPASSDRASSAPASSEPASSSAASSTPASSGTVSSREEPQSSEAPSDVPPPASSAHPAESSPASQPAPREPAPASSEGQSYAPIDHGTNPGERTVYWGESGTKYHIDSGCRSFKGNTPHSGSIADAVAAGRTGWCGICSKGMG